MSRTKECIIVACRETTPLGRDIAAELGMNFSEMQRKQFADGEFYHAFPGEVAGRHLIIVGSTHSNDAHMELLDMIQGGRFWNAASINVVIPYLGYSPMERAKPDSYEIPKGITRTRQIFRARPDFVAFVDLHSEAVLHAHTGEIRTKHVHTDSLVAEKIRTIARSDYVLVSPDYGFSKQVAKLASLLDCPHTAADKDRFDTDKTIVSQVSSVVKGKAVIICDDMIRTGGSIIQTADRCRQAGAVDISVLATHLVMAGEARKHFIENGITRVIGSDSFPGRKSDELLEVYSLAPLLAETLNKYLKLSD